MNTARNGTDMRTAKCILSIALVLVAPAGAAQTDEEVVAATDAGGEAAEPAKEPEGGKESRSERMKGALEEEPGFEVGGELAAMWMLRDEYRQPGNEFRVSRARLELSWSQWKLVKAVVKLEAKELFTGADASAVLRDVYVRVQPLRQLGLRVGQFKKPFSRTELTGRSRYPLINRGIGNDYAVDHLLFGDRDIGAMLEGRLVESVKLDYAIGVFNGLGMNTTEIGLDGAKDVAARVELDPVEWLEIGASGSLKLIEKTDLPAFVSEADFDAVAAAYPDDYPYGYSATDFIAEHEWMAGAAWMAGADVAFTPGKWRIVGEAMLGENWWFEELPYTWTGLLLVSYRFRVAKGVPLWLEPVVGAEVLSFLNDGMDKLRARLWSVSPGINLHVGRHVRFMVDGELQFAEGDKARFDAARRSGLWPNEYPGNWLDQKRLMIQLAFAI